MESSGCDMETRNSYKQDTLTLQPKGLRRLYKHLGQMSPDVEVFSSEKDNIFRGKFCSNRINTNNPNCLGEGLYFLLSGNVSEKNLWIFPPPTLVMDTAQIIAQYKEHGTIWFTVASRFSSVIYQIFRNKSIKCVFKLCRKNEKNIFNIRPTDDYITFELDTTNKNLKRK